ncbi:MAG: hypothetical protein ACOC93_00095 [Planctomycetota bacterium]
MEPVSAPKPAVYVDQLTYGLEYAASGLPAESRGRYATSPVTVDYVLTYGRMARPHSDPMLAGLYDRKNISSMVLDDLIQQAHSRIELYRRHLSELDDQEIALRNASRRCLRPPGWEPQDDPEILRDLQNIDDQRRRERLDFWRDMSRLRLMVPESAEAYLGASRRLAALTQQDSPQ